MSTPIERAAEAMHALGNSDPWERQHEYVRQEFRDDARAALSAAIDVDELARVIALHEPGPAGRCQGCSYRHDWGSGEFWISAFDKHVAQAVRDYLTGDENDE